MTLKRPSGTDEVTGIAGPTLECFQATCYFWK